MSVFKFLADIKIIETQQSIFNVRKSNNYKRNGKKSHHILKFAIKIGINKKLL